MNFVNFFYVLQEEEFQELKENKYISKIRIFFQKRNKN